MVYRNTEPKIATVGADNRINSEKTCVSCVTLGTVVEIAGSVSPDERIVANPPDSIEDGEEVRVMEAAGKRTEGPSAAQHAEGAKAGPKSAAELAQTGHHGE